jgi:hypothetical protein
MQECIKEVKLLAVRDGLYTVYVFQTLDTKEYIMCTKLPNWKVPEISIGDEGFLQYQIVQAGEEYFNVETQNMVKYNYSNIYFNNFILRTENINNDKIIF